MSVTYQSLPSSATETMTSWLLVDNKSPGRGEGGRYRGDIAIVQTGRDGIGGVGNGEIVGTRQAGSPAPP